MAAVKDHRNHLDTPGARIFGRLLTYTRQLLSYGAYVALAYLVFNILLAVQISFEKHKVLPLPGMVEARAALFNVLFFSLAAPIVIVALYITFRMLGNHIAAAAWRWLPRFAAPLFYPLMLIVLVFNINVHRLQITQQLTGVYVYAESMLASASGHQAVVISTQPEAGQQNQDMAAVAKVHRSLLEELGMRDPIEKNPE